MRHRHRSLAQKKIEGLRTKFKRAFYRAKIQPDIITQPQRVVLRRLEHELLSASASISASTSALERVHIFPLDAHYRIVSRATLAMLLQQMWVPHEIYLADYFDCDDFAFLLKANLALYYRLNCVGIVLNYAGGHAFNIAILKEGLYGLEPQGGRLWPAPVKSPPSRRYKIIDAEAETVILI